MSKQAFKAFMEKVATDAALRVTLQKAGADGVSVETLAKVGAAHGFQFAAEDVTDELSESQLDGVAGGATFVKFLGVEGEATHQDHKIRFG